MSEDSMPRIVASQPSDQQVAADLKARITEAFGPVLALMDEASSKGMLVRWDGVSPAPPYMRHTLLGLRIEKHY